MISEHLGFIFYLSFFEFHFSTDFAVFPVVIKIYRILCNSRLILCDFVILAVPKGSELFVYYVFYFQRTQLQSEELDNSPFFLSFVS